MGASRIRVDGINHFIIIWCEGGTNTIRYNPSITTWQFIYPEQREVRLAAVLRFLLGDEAAQEVLGETAAVARCLAGTVFGGDGVWGEWVGGIGVSSG